MNLTSVNSLVEQSITNGIFPSACYAIGHKGRIQIQAFGRYMYCPDSQAVTTETMFDLASLSKVVGCTTAAMILHDEGKLDLDRPVAADLPDFGVNGKEKITPRNLLLHNAGFPGWIPFHETPTLTADQCIKMLFDSKLAYPTGTKTVYSDCSMITLGLLIAQIVSQPMDVFLKARVFEPLGMTRTMYRPADKGMGGECAPTELLEDWRIKAREARHELPAERGAQCHPDAHLYVQGEVHDPSAYMIGGVSGNAGLFSTIGDLSVFVQMMMGQGALWGKRLVKAETVTGWTKRIDPHESRGLGWDIKSEQSEMKKPTDRPSAGDFFSMKSFGHTGYTGTSIWADPVNQLYAVLLTNRVHPSSVNERFNKITRPAFYDAVAHAAGL